MLLFSRGSNICSKRELQARWPEIALITNGFQFEWREFSLNLFAVRGLSSILGLLTSPLGFNWEGACEHYRLCISSDRYNQPIKFPVFGPLQPVDYGISEVHIQPKASVQLMATFWSGRNSPDGEAVCQLSRTVDPHPADSGALERHADHPSRPHLLSAGVLASGCGVEFKCPISE